MPAGHSPAHARLRGGGMACWGRRCLAVLLPSVMHAVARIRSLFVSPPHPLFMAICHGHAVACDRDLGCVHQPPAKSSVTDTLGRLLRGRLAA
jgi:hypothetical protein